MGTFSEGFAQSLCSFAHPFTLAAGPLQQGRPEAEAKRVSLSLGFVHYTEKEALK